MWNSERRNSFSVPTAVTQLGDAALLENSYLSSHNVAGLLELLRNPPSDGIPGLTGTVLLSNGFVDDTAFPGWVQPSGGQSADFVTEYKDPGHQHDGSSDPAQRHLHRREPVSAETLPLDDVCQALAAVRLQSPAEIPRPPHTSHDPVANFPLENNSGCFRANERDFPQKLEESVGALLRYGAVPDPSRSLSQYSVTNEQELGQPEHEQQPRKKKRTRRGGRHRRHRCGRNRTADGPMAGGNEAPESEHSSPKASNGNASQRQEKLTSGTAPVGAGSGVDQLLMRPSQQTVAVPNGPYASFGSGLSVHRERSPAALQEDTQEGIGSQQHLKDFLASILGYGQLGNDGTSLPLNTGAMLDSWCQSSFPQDAARLLLRNHGGSTPSKALQALHHAARLASKQQQDQQQLGIMKSGRLPFFPHDFHAAQQGPWVPPQLPHPHSGAGAGQQSMSGNVGHGMLRGRQSFGHGLTAPSPDLCITPQMPHVLTQNRFCNGAWPADGLDAVGRTWLQAMDCHALPQPPPHHFPGQMSPSGGCEYDPALSLGYCHGLYPGPTAPDVGYAGTSCDPELAVRYLGSLLE